MEYECPGCGKISVYSKPLGRYVHVDGTENKSCWSTILRGDGKNTGRTDLWIDPLEVICPSCGSSPGQPCVGRKDRHAPRVDRAIRLHHEVIRATNGTF